MELFRQVRGTMEAYHMTEKGGHIVAAVSGGADSACLLRVLKSLSGPMDFTLEALHVNHGLRGAEADRDEEFTRRLCGELSVPFQAVRADVRACGKEWGLSEEEAGRKVRYGALRKLAAERRAEREASLGPDAPPCVIATAHHRDDSAETVLHNLFRGSGLKGLGGIRPVSGEIIRPLIQTSRSEIETWMEENGFPWCEDSTNGDTDYTRNRIRNQILPLAAGVNSQAAANIVRAGSFIAQADEYLETQAADLCARHCFRDGESVGIPPWAISGEPPILRAYAIRHMLRLAGCPLRDVGAVHLEAAVSLLGGQAGKRTEFPGGYGAWNGYEAFFVGPKPEIKEEPALPRLRISVFPLEKGMEIPKNQYTKWFDYDKMKDVPFLRFRQTGDYFELPGGGKKSLKAYMIDEKIPRGLRDRIPVLAEKSHVIWMIGYRISEYYKVTAQTKQIMEVTVDGGKE